MGITLKGEWGLIEKTCSLTLFPLTSAYFPIQSLYFPRSVNFYLPSVLFHSALSYVQRNRRTIIMKYTFRLI